MLKYKDQLEQCLDRLSRNVAPFRTLDIDGEIIRSLRCQKHYIFALEQPDKPLLIIAVLHERMDLVNRLTDRL